LLVLEYSTWEMLSVSLTVIVIVVAVAIAVRLEHFLARQNRVRLVIASTVKLRWEEDYAGFFSPGLRAAVH